MNIIASLTKLIKCSAPSSKLVQKPAAQKVVNHEDKKKREKVWLGNQMRSAGKILKSIYHEVGSLVSRV